MLSRATRCLAGKSGAIFKQIAKPIVISKALPIVQSVRFNTSKAEATTTTTNLFDDSDPNREHIFKYTWGTWLKNDQLEKQKRFTKFSINGLNELMKKIHDIKASDLKMDNDPDAIKNVENTKVLTNNIAKFFNIHVNEIGNIKQIVSLHEGKHHRIYRVELEDNDKKLVLRLPYTLHSKLFTKRKLESEVATMDFLNNALNMNIPKVLAYSGDYDNGIGHPFILMECVDDVESSLMKKWNPLIESKEDKLDDPEAIEELNKVIEPLADFTKIVGDFIFDNYGSLYFKDDCPENLRSNAYEGQDRWVIGPTVDPAYYRNKELVKEETLNKYVGPWKSTEPLKMIKDLAQLEEESLKLRLSVVESGAVTKDQKKDLELAINTFGKLNKVAGELFNLNENETLIPNLPELLKPRLHIADLDPMNVLIRKEGKGYEFVDFENSVVKPFLISNYPKFLEYNGAKVFSLKEEVENYENMDELEKEQYKFMFKRTRNQFLWEVGINKRSKELVGVISPVIKLVKNCYLNVLNFKTLKDSLYVENGLIEISTMWDNYNSNGVVGQRKGEPNPIPFTEQEINEFSTRIQEYQMESSSKPFVATNGWVPQDMFQKLQEQGMLVRDADKDEWMIDTEQVLK